MIIEIKTLKLKSIVSSILMILALACLSGNLSAQSLDYYPVSGTVLDELEDPVIGATVYLKGTNQYTTTDINGNFSIDAKSGQLLVFCLLGYEETNVVVNKSEINVKLKQEANLIDETIVTGYQTISKERAAGSYAIINKEAIEQKPTMDLSNALKGLVAGMETVSEGENTRFVIRGVGTLQSVQNDKDPLIVVDGYAVQSYGMNGDPFSTINPNDVESISVLKDAAATSIYGARASNGVIVITTKQAKNRKMNISFDAFASVSAKPDLDNYLNMASAESQFWFAENTWKYYPSAQASTLNPYNDPKKPYKALPDQARLLLETFTMGNMTEAEYNAEKARLIKNGSNDVLHDQLNKLVYQNAINQQYNLGISGAEKNANYAFSVVYDNSKGSQIGDFNQRVLINLKTNFRLAKGLNLEISNNAKIANSQNNGVGEIVSSAISPWSRLVDEKGNYTFFQRPISVFGNAFNADMTIYEPILLSKYEGKTPASWFYNPVQDREHIDNTSNTFNYRFQAGLSYKTDFGLSLNLKGQYERSQVETREEYGMESYRVRHMYNRFSTLNSTTDKYVSYFPQGGYFTEAGNNYQGYNLRAQADYNKTFNNHSLIAFLGTEIIASTIDGIPSVTRYGYNPNTNSSLTSLDYITLKPNIFGVSERLPFEKNGSISTKEDRFFSAYANLGYGYDDRYTVTASLRTDASNYQMKDLRSKFSPFWSLGGVWLIDNEDFLKDVDFINLLKLRASFGVAGIAAGRSGSSSVTTLSSKIPSLIYTNNEAYSSIASRGNTSLTWEKSQTLNIGADFAFLNHKLYGSVEFYNKFSYDVLSSASVPIILQGVTSATYNNAEILNRGFELSLGSNLRTESGFNWVGDLNYSLNNNKLVGYNVNNIYTTPTKVVGYPLGSIFNYQIKGYTDEGLMILQGKDGSEEIVKNMATTHIYDKLAPGETLEDYNWSYYLGSYTPKHYMSFSSQFKYKGFTLSFMLTGKFGYYVDREDSAYTFHTLFKYPSNLDHAIEVAKEGYANQSSYTAFPIFNEDNKSVLNSGSTISYMTNLHRKSQANYMKGDHIRIEEIYFGYQIPTSVLANVGWLNGLTVYAQAKNLGILWSANGEMDPSYPLGTFKPLTTFTFGLRLRM